MEKYKTDLTLSDTFETDVKKLLSCAKAWPRSSEWTHSLLIATTEDLLTLKEKFRTFLETYRDRKEIIEKKEEPFISLLEFYTRTGFHPSTTARQLINDKNFSLHCGNVSDKKRYLIKELAALNYLAEFGSDQARRKAQKILKLCNFRKSLENDATA